MLAVADLTASLGGLLRLVVPAEGAEVDDLVIAELAHGLVGRPHDLVLGVGVGTTPDALHLLAEAAAVQAGGVVLRRSLARGDQVREAAQRGGLALVEITEQASWAHLVWLLRGLIDRAAVGPARIDDAPVLDDLFSLADAAAAVVDAPVTIEDQRSRVLAYSARQDSADPARVSTIIGRRVPADVLAALRAQGVFRRLASSSEPVFVPASEGTKPRLVVPVRVGQEWLGSIWAVVEARPPVQVVAELAQTATVVALHLLALRAQADLPRLVAADRLGAVLEGHAHELPDWLPPGPWRVAALGGGADSAPQLLHLWESLCRRHGWRQPLLAELTGGVYAVLQDQEATTPGTWGWLTSVVLLASEDTLGLNVRAGRAVGVADQLPRSLAQAQEARRVAAPTSPVATHDQMWAEVTVARAAAALSGELLGPVTLLRSHDEEQGSDYLRTLTAFLDFPGTPTRAASSIHVHPNTLRYRMSRIIELSGVDLDDPQVRLALRLQLAAATHPASTR